MNSCIQIFILNTLTSIIYWSIYSLLLLIYTYLLFCLIDINLYSPRLCMLYSHVHIQEIYLSYLCFVKYWMHSKVSKPHLYLFSSIFATVAFDWSLRPSRYNYDIMDKSLFGLFLSKQNFRRMQVFLNIYSLLLFSCSSASPYILQTFYFIWAFLNTLIFTNIMLQVTLIYIVLLTI